MFSKSATETILRVANEAGSRLSDERYGEGTRIGAILQIPILAFYKGKGCFGNTTVIKERFPMCTYGVEYCTRMYVDVNVLNNIRRGYFLIENYDHSNADFNCFLSKIAGKGIQVITTSRDKPKVKASEFLYLIECGYPDFLYKEDRGDGYLHILVKTQKEQEVAGV